MIAVAVAGSEGKVGRAICAAVEEANDLTLVGRADPVLGTTVADVLEAAEVVVDFTRPDVALDNALACLNAGVHVVIGTTGFDPAPLRGEFSANAIVAPNFAIGAVLMMRFAAEAAQHMAKAEIIELHHDQKLDAPSGTAARTAELMGGDVPIHSVRLPGLVAHQEVIFGDVGQTLSIRHDTTSRDSFVPGVLLAVRRVGALESSPVFGLESLLFRSVIRPVTPADVPAIAGVHLRAWRWAYRELLSPEAFDYHDEDTLTARWADVAADPARPAWVFDQGGDVAGAVFLVGPELRGMYVDPPAQGAGVGTRLLMAAHEAGARELSVLAANAAARAFYEHHGWTFDGDGEPWMGEPLARYRRPV